MKNLDGITLKDMLVSGGNNLYNHYQEVDALNVFPVPDGDTGMNMNLTVTSGCKEIENREDSNIYEIAKTFARGTLFGARGNSGVITSQIFRGFSQGLENKSSVNAVEFSEALEKGVEVAYKAVLKPVEGTILTVVREASHYLHENVKASFTIEKCLELFLLEARESLKRTPELLPVLKEVGVVDSGGTGLIYIFDGMYKAITSGIVVRNEKETASADSPLVAAGASMESEEFGYCTEFIMELGPDSVKKPFNEKRFTSILASHGNSLVVVHDENIVKVHVHTLQPGGVLTYAQQFGEFLKLKIENMTEQHHALASGAQVDEHTDLVPEPEKEQPHQPFALIAVSSGDGIDEFFNEIGVTELVKGGQTMNPSSEDFLAAIKHANADNIFIFPNNSNIVMAATQAAEMSENDNVYVVPSKTILQGLSAAMMFNPEASNEDNMEEMKAALKNVTSGEVTFSIRDTEINGLSIKKDEFIGIMNKEIVVHGDDKKEVLLQLVEKMVDEDSSLITLLCGEDVDDEMMEEVQAYLEENYSDLDLDVRKGNQPVYSFLIGVE